MKKLAIITALALSLATTAATAAENKFTPIKESPAIWANVPQSLKSAKWLWRAYPYEAYEIVNVYCLGRRTFDLESVPRKAPIFITADQSYRLFINGKFVCSGPARGYQFSQPFDEIDVAKYLQKGRNVIAVRAYNAGRSTFSYLTQGYAGFIFALELGGGRNIVSDTATKVRTQEGCDRNTAQLSIQMNNQEHIDLRVENPDWIQTGFDDSSWGKPSSRPYNAMPYYSMESRMIPMLEEFEMKPEALVSRGSGKSVSNGERVFDVAKLFVAENIPHTVKTESVFEVEAKPSKDGVSSFVFDMGRMCVGMPILEIDGAKGGEIVDMLATELLKDGTGNPVGGSKIAAANRIICRAGKQRHMFFNPFGVRYITVRVRNNPDSTIKVKPSLMWSAYPLADKGKFKTSNAYVDKIWQACKQTQKICALDAYVDTPYREQAQWWGDARVQSWNTFFISGDARLLRRGIRSISMQKVPNGLTYGHAPTSSHHCILPDFSLTWILTLYDYYWQTGSIEAYLSHRDTVASILSYFDGMTDPETGLVKADNRYWLFLDWTNIQKIGQPAILNLWLLEALEKMQKLCTDNAISGDAKMYAERAAKVRAAIEKNLVKKDGLISDGILPDGSQNTESSIHAQVLGKMTGIKGLDFEKAKREMLLPFLGGKKKFKAMPSSFWVVYVLELMADEGHGAEVYDYIKRNWREFAEYGTTFENFDGKASHSHAWSAHPAFLLPRILGGIRQKAPAWTEVSFKPNFFEDFAEITYPTPQGDIKVSWRKNADGKFSSTVDAPKGISVSK